MDSKELYNATAYLNGVIVWDKDWIPYYTGDEIKYDLITQLIEDFLISDNLYFIYKRQSSGSYKKSEIIIVIKEFLGRDDFKVWNSQLDRAINFNKIGVLQIGRK